jgi:anti-sigma factor RsiW
MNRKMKNINLSELLIRSLDDALPPAEQTALDAGLAASPALREEHRQLLAMRKALGQIKAAPAPNFTDQVMRRLPIRQGLSFTSAIIRLYPQAAAACVAVLIIGLLSIYLSEGNLSVEALVGIQELSVDEAYSLVIE